MRYLPQALNLKTSDEILGIKIEIPGHSFKIKGKIYRPTNREVEQAVKDISDILAEIRKNYRNEIVLAGDW